MLRVYPIFRGVRVGGFSALRRGEAEGEFELVRDEIGSGKEVMIRQRVVRDMVCITSMAIPCTSGSGLYR